jgi:hypothetical protein
VCDAATHRRVLDAIASLPGRQAVILYGNFRPGVINGTTDLRIDDAPLSLDAFRRQLQLARDRLAARHKRFALIEQGPQFAKRAASFYLRDRLAGRFDELSVPRSDQEQDRRTLDQVRAAFDQVVPTIDLFCGPRLCIARDAQGLVTSDREHLTRRWSWKLADETLNAVLPSPIALAPDPP